MSFENSKRAMILTVGTEAANGSRLSRELIRSVSEFDYDMLSLIASPESLEAAEKLAGRLDMPDDSVRIYTLESAHNLDSVFRTVNSAINRMISRGFDVDRITVNYTSGTKVMSSGAVLSAIYNSCESLLYITGSGGGDRDTLRLTTRPRAVLAYRELMRARQHMLATQFRSAVEAFETIDTSLLSEYDESVATQLRILAAAYSAWEANRPDEFLEHYAKVEFGAPELEPFQLREGQSDVLQSLAEDLKARRRSTLLCVEMRNSAERLLFEQHPDDASERVYRSLEILAQYIMEAKYDTSTDDLDVRKAPPRDRSRFEALRSLDDGIIKIGLMKTFELLSLLEEPIGDDFFADKELQDCLRERNLSLLAHGAAPAAMEQAENFLRVASQFCERHIKGFQSLCANLQFPWMEPEGAETRIAAPNKRS